MKFSKVKFFSSNGFLMLFLFAIALSVSITSFKYADIPLAVRICFFLVDFIIFGVILWGFTSKVELKEEGIRYSSFLGDTFIKWGNVKSYGVYVVGSGAKQTIREEEYYKFKLGLQKFIYLSENDFIPGKFKWKPSKGYIDFHFRDEAMMFIESIFNKNPS